MAKGAGAERRARAAGAVYLGSLWHRRRTKTEFTAAMRFRLLSFRLLTCVAVSLLLAAVLPAGEQASEEVYPIWDHDNYVEQYEQAVASSEVVLLTGGILVALLLGLALYRVLSKRQRFSFSLRWLVAFILAQGITLYGAVGWWIATRPEPGDVQFREAVQKALEERVSLKIDEANDLGAVVQLLQSSDVYVVLSPDLKGAKMKTSLALTNVRRREAINTVCRSVGAGCDIRNGAMLVYPEDQRPAIRERLSPRTGWEAEMAHRISGRMGFEFVDQPLSEVLKTTRTVTKIRLRVDPERQPEDVQIKTCHVKDMRIDDALTWFCFLSGTEWTLRESEDGLGEILVSAREAKH